MPMYVCLVHVDPRKFDGITEADQRALDAENYEADQKLLKSGHLITAGPLAEPQTATLMRIVDGKVSMTDGPYVETKERLGGLVVIKADSREEAIELLLKDNSMARYGTLEVREHWPLEPPAEGK